MITKLSGINYEAFDKKTNANLNGLFDSEENLKILDERVPCPTIAEIIGISVGAAYGLSIEELTRTIDGSDDVKKELNEVFEKMYSYMTDNFELTMFDKV